MPSFETATFFDSELGRKAKFVFESRPKTAMIRGVNVSFEAALWYSTESSDEIVDLSRISPDPMVLAYNAYRKEVGLPMPQELALIRTTRGFSRAALAAILGCEEDDIQRYEDVGALPVDFPMEKCRKFVSENSSPTAQHAVVELKSASTNLVPVAPVVISIPNPFEKSSAQPESSSIPSKNVVGRITSPPRSLSLAA